MNLWRQPKQMDRHAQAGQIAVFVLAAVLAVGAAVVRGATDANGAPSDTEVAYAIEVALLEDPGVSAHLIDATVNQGVVTLSGTVSNVLERDRAVRVATTVKGVRGIIDQLDVRAVERSDANIRGDVHRALAHDPATDSYEIDVDVDDGVVTLHGTVGSWAEKLLVAEVAKGVKGVHAVENRVTYSYEWDRADEDIEAEIEGRLKMDPYITEELIDVTVDDGVVTLGGTVGSLAEKNYAIAKAHTAGTTRVIDDELTVKPWVRGPMERSSKVVPVTDAEARRAAEEAFEYDPRVSSHRVDVEVESGVATLMGTVDNLKARRAAEQDARNTMGIWKVDNRIKVRPSQELSDTEIAENVRDALLRDPVVERFDISVLVRNRRVILMGAVDSSFEKMHAEDVVSRVSGVASVDNKLVVDEEWTYKSDSEIKENIESKFFWSPFVSGDELKVQVDEGHVEIVGKVGTWHEYRKAVEKAFEGGARSVRSYMWVESNGEMYDRSWSGPPEVWPL